MAMKFVNNKVKAARILCTVGALVGALIVTVPAVDSTAGAASAHMKQGVEFMTLAQGAALGITPNEPGPSGGVHTVGYTYVHADSAKGCNQAVCINIIGQGLFVSEWNTTAYFVNGQETFAVDWVNGSIYSTGPLDNVPPGAYGYDDYAVESYFANGSQLCNTWFADNGKPCETVHS